MSKTTVITVLALLAVAAADPLVYSAPLVAYASSPYTSAAYYSPTASVVAAPVGPAAVSPAVPATYPAAVPAAYPAAVPAATYPAAVPYATVSAYSYGSSYSVQDYFPTVVNPSPSLAYSLPYAYAADYYYRR